LVVYLKTTSGISICKRNSIRIKLTLAIGPLVLLAIDSDRLVPGPHVIDKLLVLLVLGVELLEIVRLDIRGDIEGGESLLTADEESTTNDRIVGDTVDGSGTENVLAGSLETSEEATDEVGGHEGHGELIVVLVVHLPQRVLLKVDVLPEPGKGNLTRLLVRVLALQLVENEGGAAEGLKRVLGLGLLGSVILVVIVGGSLGLCSLLGLLGLGLVSLGCGLLLGGNVGDGLLDELELLSNVGVDGLVDDGGEPTGNIGVGAAPLLVKEVLEAAGDDAGSEEVGEGEALTNEVSAGKEVVLEGTDSLGGGLLGIVHRLLVVRVTADEGAEPATEGAEDLSVGKGHPSEDGGVVLLGLAEEGGLLVLGGDCFLQVSMLSLGFVVWQVFGQMMGIAGFQIKKNSQQ
jgi:hypothetical protein